MAEQGGPAGPDLRQGVPAASVPDGGMVAGQVEGEEVLLVHQGDDWFAIGAKCSHYSGPLAEGLLVDGTVRCPWHHACFDLRSGVPLRPPALHDLPVWQVEVRDGTVRVGRKRESPRRARHVTQPESVVIVGGGAAGNMAAETLRRDGYAGPITIVDPDGDAPYDRPNLSKDYLAGSAPEDWIPLHPAEFYRDQEITIRHGRQAASLDIRGRRVRLDDGTDLSYHALLLATGASPVRLGPELEAGPPAVHYLRSLADSRRIVSAAREGAKAVVLGASFIGLEVAASLRARKMEVHVVAPDARPLERVVGPELGDMIRGIHEAHGVVFHLGRKPVRIGQGRVSLDGGESLPADLLVAGIGVRPNLALAEGAGLTLDRGVAVDPRLETSAPGVFAAGDIARWPDPHSGDRIRVEHWVVAERQGQAAARSILGASEPFAAVPFFWSQHYDVVLNYDGHAERWDRINLDGDLAKRDATLRYWRGDRELAVVTVGRDKPSLEAELAMERRATGPERRPVTP
jgi:NADPH-dependent 2,4-dienoyl-CoA reductase/sulfur reductase-like enzyme/nitrite reductase/ring-hydroxylating ferredoxin subunit